MKIFCAEFMAGGAGFARTTTASHMITDDSLKLPSSLKLGLTGPQSNRKQDYKGLYESLSQVHTDDVFVLGRQRFYF